MAAVSMLRFQSKCCRRQRRLACKLSPIWLNSDIKPASSGKLFMKTAEAVKASLLKPVSAQFNSMVNASQDYIGLSLEAAEAYLIGLYSALGDLLNLLLEQPGATLTALYHNTLSAALDVYFELVSSLLSLL